MKIVITSSGERLNSKFDMRFGRCKWFCIWDSEKQSAEFIENTFKTLNGGAGTRAAELVAELNAAQVVSGDFGPKAKMLLDQFKIKLTVYDTPEMTVQEIIDLVNHKM
jgi:predicted Fe-Mo cluster-binding NifX family protein